MENKQGTFYAMKDLTAVDGSEICQGEIIDVQSTTINDGVLTVECWQFNNSELLEIEIDAAIDSTFDRFFLNVPSLNEALVWQI